VINLRTADIATELQRRGAWGAAVKAGRVTAYRIGGAVTISAPSGTQVTATMPTGTRQVLLLGLGSVPFGSAYAGAVSGWAQPGLLQSAVSLAVPASQVPVTGAVSSAVGTAKVQSSAAGLPVPSGVVNAVPYGPGDSAKR
jgi:hypothetical protein